MVNDTYSFESGVSVYETLSGKSSDRYQFILPYYDFEKSFSSNFLDGNLNFYSSGSNDLNSTNKVDTSIINDISFRSRRLLCN